ncbi:hypothetical protein M9Y10_035165 [Tritrichomonas musculus]|uniref:Uncharacterized protein n=1 Tax=Tritrichomonas musculus TaxID=1915356 RepID=A0ABR2KH25_9EUKA
MEPEINEDEGFHPSVDLGSAQPFKEKLPMPNSTFYDAASMIVLSISFFGTIFAQPTINWVAFFVLYAININRPPSQIKISQSMMALIMVIFLTFYLYYRMMHGYAIFVENARKKQHTSA